MEERYGRFNVLELVGQGGFGTVYKARDEELDRTIAEYFESAVDGVVEIHSPGDETSDKLAYSEELGVAEAEVIHRDTRQPEVYLLKKSCYRKQRSVQG